MTKKRLPVIQNVKMILLLILFFSGSLDTEAFRNNQKNHENKCASKEDVIFYGGFENDFNNDAWLRHWGIQWVNRKEENEIVPNGFNGGKSLRVNYPEGGLGPTETGTQFPMLFKDMEGVPGDYYQEIYLRYYICFEEGFDFNKGGKLPGLMGGGKSWTRSGGKQPDGTNGWTLRFMWRTGGKIVVYAYVPKSENGKWGNDKWGQNIACNFTTTPGEWHCIEQYVNVGTPGKDDGKLKVWIDGTERVNIDDIRFWNEENDQGRIGGVYFSTFHGGNSPDWSPRNDSFALFDEFCLAKERIRDYIKK